MELCGEYKHGYLLSERRRGTECRKALGFLKDFYNKFACYIYLRQLLDNLWYFMQDMNPLRMKEFSDTTMKRYLSSEY